MTTKFSILKKNYASLILKLKLVVFHDILPYLLGWFWPKKTKVIQGVITFFFSDNIFFFCKNQFLTIRSTKKKKSYQKKKNVITYLAPNLGRFWHKTMISSNGKTSIYIIFPTKICHIQHFIIDSRSRF